MWAHAKEKVGELRPAMPGTHNALNALAAVLAGMQAELVSRRALRRSAIRWCRPALSAQGHHSRHRFYDDYGHHPTEIRAVLGGFKEKFPTRRLVTFFNRTLYAHADLLE